MTTSPIAWIQRYGTFTALESSTSSGLDSPMKRPSIFFPSRSITRLFTFPRKTPFGVYTCSPMSSEASSIIRHHAAEMVVTSFKLFAGRRPLQMATESPRTPS